MRTGMPNSVTKLLQSSSSPSRSTMSSMRTRPSRTRSSMLTLGGTSVLTRSPARGHRHQILGFDPEHLGEVVLGVELGPGHVQEAEEGLEHALPVHGARLED